MNRSLSLLIALIFTTSVFAAPIPFDSGTQEEIIAAIDQFVHGKPKKAELTSQLSAIAKAAKNPAMSVKVRESAVWALGEMKDKNHIPILIEAAKDKGLLVRAAAIHSLIKIRSRLALDTFVNVANNDPVLSLRQRATLGLGLLQSDKAIQPLVKLSSDDRDEIRGMSALSMAATHSKRNDFSEALKEMTQDTSPYVQNHAKIGLKIVGRKNADVRSLLESQDADVRLFAALYFREFGTSADQASLQQAVEGEPIDLVQDQLKTSISAIKSRIAQAAAKKKAAAAAAAAAAAEAAKKAAQTPPSSNTKP